MPHFNFRGNEGKFLLTAINYHMALQEFLDELYISAQNNNIKLELVDEPSILINGIKYSGVFQSNIPSLSVAIGKPEAQWQEILIHESCHMDQWIEQCAAWRNTAEKGYSFVADWLEGTCELSDKKLNQYIRNCIVLERDCEKRTVKKIKQYKIDIDINQYVKKANAYLFFYRFVQKNRRWNAQHPAYEEPTIIAAMPNKILNIKEYKNYELYEELYNSWNP